MAIRGPYNQTGLCKFNNYVWCETRESCETCGWNPEVALDRKTKLGFVHNNLMAPEKIVKRYDILDACKYNYFVHCKSKNTCQECHWNPKK